MVQRITVPKRLLSITDLVKRINTNLARGEVPLVLGHPEQIFPRKCPFLYYGDSAPYDGKKAYLASIEHDRPEGWNPQWLVKYRLYRPPKFAAFHPLHPDGRMGFVWLETGFMGMSEEEEKRYSTLRFTTRASIKLLENLLPRCTIKLFRTEEQARRGEPPIRRDQKRLFPGAIKQAYNLRVIPWPTWNRADFSKIFPNEWFYPISEPKGKVEEPPKEKQSLEEDIPFWQ